MSEATELGARDMTEEPEMTNLRRQLATEKERALNAVDAMRGAQAEAAEVRARVRELEYELHVRTSELEALLGLDQAPQPSETSEPNRTVAAGDEEDGRASVGFGSELLATAGLLLRSGVSLAANRVPSERAKSVAEARLEDVKAVSQRLRDS